MAGPAASAPPSLLAAGLALVLLPVLLRNRVVGEEWVFTTSQAGANLFIGNNAGNVTGTYAVPHFVRPSPLYEEEDFRRFAEHTVGRALGASEVSRFYVGQVVDWALRDPARFLRLQGTKLLAFVDRWEYPDNWSLYFVRRFSPVLALPLLSYGVVVPFAALGLVAAFRRPRDPARVFFALLVLAYAGLGGRLLRVLALPLPHRLRPRGPGRARGGDACGRTSWSAAGRGPRSASWS